MSTNVRIHAVLILYVIILLEVISANVSSVLLVSILNVIILWVHINVFVVLVTLEILPSFAPVFAIISKIVSHFSNNCCLDIDECLQNPCGPGADCINIAGSYQCQCPDKYVARGTPEFGCDRAAVDVSCKFDFDCTLNAGCVDSSCRCKPGYQINGIECIGLSMSVYLFSILTIILLLKMWTNAKTETFVEIMPNVLTLTEVMSVSADQAMKR